jgi:Calx-beta domain
MRLTRVALGTVALGLVMTAVPSSKAYSADNPRAAETADAPDVPVVGEATGPVRIWEPDGALLYDNGSLITHPGVCSAGASASRLQSALGLNIFGFTASTATAFRIADNFTVPPGGGWNISELVLFGYQTGSTTTPTFNNARVQIWNGPPNAGGVVVFGDTTTNRFASAAFSNIYRDLDTAPCPAAQTRPIMAVRATVNTTLPPGNYWVDFQLGGTLASGPFIPPTSILGQTDGCPGAALCNALQFDGATWNPLTDTGTALAQQDIRFVVEGVALGSSVINAGDASVVEGNAGTVNMFLPVTLDVASPTPVTVAFATANGTATAGTDYTATSGTLTFAPGQTSANVTVSVTGDVVDEANETFFVNLSAPSGGTIGDGQGVGTIVDDDGPTINACDVSQVEGNTGASNFILPVTLSAASPGTVTVAFNSADGTATAPSDYTTTSGTLTFAPGVTSLGVTVSVNGDVVPEADETFFVNLSSPVGGTIGDGQGQGTIVNDDGSGADTTGELSHGFRVLGDLASSGGTPDEDIYQISQNPFSSYEVVVDGASGDVSPVVLQRVLGTTALQTSLPIGTGTGRSLRWANDTSNTIINETVRVASGGCTTDCASDDTYRLRAYETTYAIPRFNNFGSQVTVLLLQNPTDYSVTATVYFWNTSGTLLHAEPVTVGPKSLEVRVTSLIPAVATASGSITITHTGRFGDLAGKTVALEPSTGFSFDSPMLPR